VNQGPSFKYLFVIAAILIIVFFLRYQQGSLDTYAYVISGILLLGLGLGIWQRWRSFKTNTQQIGDENELQCLEEMAHDYAQGRYDNRQYIERCFGEYQRDHKLPSRAVQSRLDAIVRDLEEGDTRRGFGVRGDSSGL
jgi:hypothetical protein